MPQADFAYMPAKDAAGMPLGVSIFADRAHLREQIRDDAAAAGLAVRECGPVAALLEGDPRPLGEVVLCDVPRAEAAGLAALARLDMRAARAGAQLVVSTRITALDAVFACCDQSAPQILVDPTRADRVLALGRVLAKIPRLRVRELAEDDRLTLLRITEQVAQIAERLERFDARPFGVPGEDNVLRFESPTARYATQTDRDPGLLRRAPRPPLPDPRLVRRIIRQRQMRAQFLDGDLFADPAWDMLLDLTAARAEHTRVSVTSLCIASGVPPTTALRWIGVMTESGLLERTEDDIDRRRAFIALTDQAADAMAHYFAQLDCATASLS
jgi:hypothetical protein